ncbi:copper homeostasis protein CutC [Agrococcus jejuensis]|uniref:PF03932 family protein CutC n=1 Tax=Agrococcus jejuensis TaxID=399736 RepID=A0A1G8C930_9MICO|nr:copper homeostasis protein CutC [Agrococcus jejuensis]SDH41799.1 copper homeostasis protein [Agrococcus jejuensis]
MLRVEVAVSDVDGVRVAREAGAHRVELCVALEVGGLTPSLALVEHAVAAAEGMGVHVLLRSRPGDFVVDAAELDVTLRDAELVLAAGAAGIVVGPLLAGGRFDLAAMARLRDLAGDAQLTAHRGFDVRTDVEDAVADLVEVGVDRILTSGGAASAHDGVERIARAVAAADGRLTVMAGGGIRPEFVDDLVARTGIADVHLSGRSLVAPDEGFGARHRTDPAVLARVIR